ncbi:hypothetical protein [Bacillus sp. SH8-8]|uniref:hypothetical protein n=1 Tax=Bacillus sp. SH8-8 TaxID=2217830 RepID=UPI0034D46F15
MRFIIHDFILNYGMNQNSKYGITCYFAAVKDIMTYHNTNSVTITESEIYLLLNGSNIKYCENTNFFGYDFEDPENLILLNDHLKYISGHEKNIVEIIEEYIKKGNPLICFVESNYLQYHPIFSESNNDVHAIILYGIDQIKDKCYVLDSHIRIDPYKTETFIGEYSLSNILRGLQCLWVLKNLETNISWNKIIELIEERIAIYLNQQDKEADSFYGNKALGEYIKKQSELMEISEVNVWEQKSQILSYDLKFKASCQMIEYLVDINEKVKGLLTPYIPDLILLKEDWYRVSNLLLLASYQSNSSRLSLALQRANDLVKKERYIFNKVLKGISISYL